ncbi:MAG: CoA transferase subunit A [Candidatus Thermoplasmatota archaeon]|jgi:glutaconate CoA-transferase subunit A|nr:CoA transferase subunit A [Candidatus Thermoplasmatota archaeon]MCL5790174.1 CoA transferase subunit A [Candidatus Thermoplasmatota archaeon]
MRKIMSMRDAVSSFVHDGDSVYISGFTHLIDFSAGHEIIRQGRKDLELIRMTPDLVYDQMVAAGTASKLVFSYLGNPGVGSLHCIRRSVEMGEPLKVKLEEYTHGSLISALHAGGAKIPFFPVNAVGSTDLPMHNHNYRYVTDPFTGKSVLVVKPINPDVAIIHVQRADEQGNSQLWGIMGEQKELAFAGKRVIVAAEEIVESEVIKGDPNRTIVPGIAVNAVVHDPWGAHPSYVQGFYDRDNQFYLEWDRISRERRSIEEYLQEWVYGVNDRGEYIDKLGREKTDKLRMKSRNVAPINWGSVA